MKSFIRKTLSSFLVAIVTLSLATAAFAVKEGNTNNTGTDNALENGNGNKYGLYKHLYKKDTTVLVTPYFYNTRNYSTMTPNWHQWYFDEGLSQQNWFNEITWLGLFNTSSMDATAYVFVYDKNGNLLNNPDNINGIKVVVPPHKPSIFSMENFYSALFPNWDGITVMEGSVVVEVPKDITISQDGQVAVIENGTLEGSNSYIVFNGNDGTLPTENTDFRLSSYQLPMQTEAAKYLITFEMYVNGNYNNNDKVDLTNENMNYIGLCNVMNEPVNVSVTYYGTSPVDVVISEEPFVLGPQCSVNFAPTSDNNLNDWLNSLDGRKIFNAVISATNEAGEPVEALMGSQIRFRSQYLGNYDILASGLLKMR